MSKFIASTILPLVLYFDINPNFNFKDDLTTFLVLRIDDGKNRKKNSEFNFDNMSFNIFEMEL